MKIFAQLNIGIVYVHGLAKAVTLGIIGTKEEQKPPKNGTAGITGRGINGTIGRTAIGLEYILGIGPLYIIILFPYYFPYLYKVYIS